MLWIIQKNILSIDWKLKDIELIFHVKVIGLKIIGNQLNWYENQSPMSSSSRPFYLLHFLITFITT